MRGYQLMIENVMSGDPTTMAVALRSPQRQALNSATKEYLDAIMKNCECVPVGSFEREPIKPVKISLVRW